MSCFFNEVKVAAVMLGEELAKSVKKPPIANFGRVLGGHFDVCNRVKPIALACNTLNRFAYRTYGPVTEQLRLSVTVAGLSDNALNTVNPTKYLISPSAGGQLCQ